MSNKPTHQVYPADMMLATANDLREFLGRQWKRYIDAFQLNPNSFTEEANRIRPLVPSQVRNATQAMEEWHQLVYAQFRTWHQLADDLEARANLITVLEADLGGS